MPYSAAHLSELGLSLWRLRSDPVEIEPPPASTEVAPAPMPPPVQQEQLPAAAMTDHATAQQRQDEADREEADALRRAQIAKMTWDELQSYVQAQSRAGATQAVFGVGVRDAQVMVIGEAPGGDEDKQGQPFVGRAGQLLDQMLQAIGLSRDKNTYIANICKFRPPNNRDPRPDEVAEDFPYLQRQIELVQPKLLLAVGRIAAQNLLSSTQPIGRMRGQLHAFGDKGITTLVTYHPAYLLRSPREKAKAWQDLKRARSVLLDVD